VTAGELVVGEVGDQALVSKLLKEHDIDTVMHFAAYTIVPESVALPLKYYGNNTCSTRALLQACLDHQVQHFVFSSTAAVYGHARGRLRKRGVADATHQCLWHVEADDRMDAPGRGRGESAQVRGPALFQRGGLGPLGSDRPGDAGGDAAHQGGL